MKFIPTSNNNMMNNQKNTDAVMKCQTCNIFIKCKDLMEAEQRARIHMNFTRDVHKAVWELEVSE